MVMSKVNYLIENKTIEIRDEEDSYSVEIIGNSDVESREIKLDFKNSAHIRGKVLIIDSIFSGQGRSETKSIFQHLLSPLFRILKIDYEYSQTVSEETVEEIAKSWRNYNGSVSSVIFLSGDTSVFEFINGLPNDLVDSKISISVFPCGTGNSLALSMGITNVLDAVTKFLTGGTRPFYLYRARFPKGSYTIKREEKRSVRDMLFCVVCSWGFHAALVADSDSPEMRKKGIIRFKIAAEKNLTEKIQYEGSTTIDSDIIRGPYCYWLLCATDKFEPTFEISPMGNITKNNLYFISVPFSEHDNLMEIMQEVYDSGSHIRDSRVIYKEVSENQIVSLQNPKSSSNRFCVDGEIIYVPTDSGDIEISCAGNRINGIELTLVR